MGFRCFSLLGFSLSLFKFLFFFFSSFWRRERTFDQQHLSRSQSCKGFHRWTCGEIINGCLQLHTTEVLAGCRLCMCFQPQTSPGEKCGLAGTCCWASWLKTFYSLGFPTRRHCVLCTCSSFSLPFILFKRRLLKKKKFI